MFFIDTISYPGPKSSDYYSFGNRPSKVPCWLRIEARPSYPRIHADSALTTTGTGCNTGQ